MFTGAQNGRLDSGLPPRTKTALRKPGGFFVCAGNLLPKADRKNREGIAEQSDGFCFEDFSPLAHEAANAAE